MIIVFACYGQSGKNSQIQPQVNQAPKSGNAFDESTGVSWRGTINSKIPVFVSYSIQDNIVMGEIRYLNTKEKKPIRLLGTIEEGGTYRLLEFSPTGTITGIITGTPTKDFLREAGLRQKPAKNFPSHLRARIRLSSAR